MVEPVNVNRIYTSHNGVVYHADEYMRRWVCRHYDMPPDDTAVGFGVLVDGEIKAGALFFNHRANDIEAAVAVADVRAARPRVFHEILNYPFKQLRLPRVSLVIENDNERCLRCAEMLGGVIEGQKPWAARNGGPMILYGLYPQNMFYAKRHPHV